MQKLILISLLVYDAVGLLQGVGVLTSISESVIEAEVSRLFKKMEKQLVTMDPIKRISQRDGDLYYEITDLLFTKFNAPDVNIDIKGPELTVAADLRNADLGISLSWYSSYETWFKTFSISGSALVKLYGVHFTKQVTLGIDDTGTLNIRPCEECCGISIDTIDISVQGGYFSWIIDKFIGYFDHTIERLISDMSCEKLNSLTLHEANEFISTTPDNWVFNNGMSVNYRPIFIKGSRDCVQIGVTGVISMAGGEVLDIEESQVQEGCASAGNSFSFRLSQQSLQTFFNTLYTKGSLQYKLEKSKGEEQSDYIVRKGANPLAGQDPTAINVDAISEPVVDITPEGIRLKIPVLLKVTLPTTHNEMKSEISLGPRGQNSHVVKVRAELSCLLGVKIEVIGDRLMLKGTVAKPSIIVSDLLSKKTIYTKKHVNNFLMGLFQKTLVPITNLYLEEGVPIYLSSHFNLTEYNLQYHQDYIEIVGDIERRD